MSVQKIETVEEFETILEKEPNVLFLKASITCNLSQEVFEEYMKYMNAHEDVKSYYLYVQDARPLSNYIAEKYGVRHQSPQVFYIKDGELTWNESHWRISIASLTEHIG